MLRNHYAEVMNGEDAKAILWLNSFAEKNPSLKESIKSFNKYYLECLKVLRDKKLTDEELANTTSRIKIIQKFLSNESFQNKVLIDTKEENSLPLLTYEQIYKIINTKFGKDNEENIGIIMTILGKSRRESEEVLRKIDRFYNMQLKYGHTARVTFIAAYNIEELGITDEVATKAILTSALMHDIGRFYQAANYNTLNDASMEETVILSENGKEISLNVDHAVAGYYYSLMDLYQLSSLGQADYKDLIIHSIASVVVRFHQQSNKNLTEFETKITDFDFAEDLETKIITFIIDSYKNAELLNRQKSKYMYDPKHIKFIDRIVNKIVEENKKRITSQLQNAFINVAYDEEDLNDQITMITNAIEANYRNIEERLITYYKNPTTEEGQRILREIIKKIKEVINKSKDFEVITEEKIENIIKNLPEYDIARAIDNRFKTEKIPKDVKRIFNISLNSTMDADKIDILNQRATGIYNTEYNPSSYKIYPGEEKSLIELLNVFYGFNLKKDNLYISNNLVLILNMNLKSEQKEWFKKQGIILQDLVEQTKHRDLKIEPSHPLYNLIAVTPWKNVIANDSKTKKDYNSGQMPTLEVPTEIIEENLKGKSMAEKVKLYRNLIITPEQDIQFQISDDFSRDVRTLQDTYNGHSQNHIMWNSITALIWQLNQFIMVNMRTKAAIEFIRENRIIENIYLQYKEYPVIQAIIKPYLAYTLLFTDVLTVLKTNGTDLSIKPKDDSYHDVLTYDAALMTKVKLLVGNKDLSNSELLAKYCNYLDEYKTPSKTENIEENSNFTF